MTKLKLSYSSINTFKDCGYKFWLDKVRLIRPTTSSSAFLFGSALDATFEAMLQDIPNLNKIPHYNQIFNQAMQSIKINNEVIKTGFTSLLRYSKADGQIELLEELDYAEIYTKSHEALGKQIDIPDFLEYIDSCRKLKQELPIEELSLLNLIRHLCLLRKGEMIIPEMYKWVQENVVRTVSTQKEISIQNEHGDTFRGFLDAIIETKDNGIVLYDLKTSADPARDYPVESTGDSVQLGIYSQETGISQVGYLVFDKNIRKREPRVRIHEVLGTITEKHLDKVFTDIDSSVKLIKDNQFKRNLESCNKFGGCVYRDYCFKNKCMTGLIDLKGDKDEL